MCDCDNCGPECGCPCHKWAASEDQLVDKWPEANELRKLSESERKLSEREQGGGK